MSQKPGSSSSFSFEQILSWFGRFTPQLKFKLMGLHRELTSTEFESAMKSSMQLFRQVSFELAQIPKGSERARFAQAMLEVEYEMNPVQDVSCGAGCGACCKTFPKQITEDDADLLAEAVNSGLVKVDRAELRRQAQEPSKGGRCLFLGSDDKCQVYSIRPLICRKYHVSSPASACATDGEGVVPKIDLVPEIVTSASMSLPDNKIGFMSELLVSRIRQEKDKEAVFSEPTL